MRVPRRSQAQPEPERRHEHFPGAMRLSLPIFMLILAASPAARSQTYVPGQTAAAKSLQQEQLQTQQQQAVQLQQQQRATTAQPGDPGRRAQIQANQTQKRQLEQEELAAQMQLQQQQRQQLQQAITQPPSVSPPP